VIGVIVGLWILSWCCAAMLWEWAQVMSLAAHLAAGLTLLVITLTASRAAFRGLKRRRDRRDSAINRLCSPPDDASSETSPNAG
jgi:hypothetical protein